MTMYTVNKKLQNVSILYAKQFQPRAAKLGLGKIVDTGQNKQNFIPVSVDHLIQILTQISTELLWLYCSMFRAVSVNFFTCIIW